MQLQRTICSLLLVAALFQGCSTSPNAPAYGIATTMKLSLKTISGTQAAPKARTATGLSGAGIDSVVMTRARIVLRDIRFQTAEDTLEFRSSPLVLLIQPGSPMRQISVQGVPKGTYREIEFEVHRVESTDVAVILPAERAAFSDFLQGDRYSIIIEGAVYAAGSAAGDPFVFRSRINERQEFEFAPGLTIDDARNAVNVTMRVDAGLWFHSQDGLSVADPRDPGQAQLIENNMKSSIRLFEDNDYDGEEN